MARRRKKKGHSKPSPPMPPSTPPDASDPAPAAPRQPVIIKQHKAGRAARQCSEMAGGAAADCAAVCCCPCGLLKLLLETSVRLPVVLCRRARRAMARRARKRKEARMLDPRARMVRNANSLARAEWQEWPEWPSAEEVAEKDREMEAWFTNAGFWHGNNDDNEGGDDTCR